ncbi:MAG: hypothetical protein FGM29_08465 [Actinobacteria bacterium]|nr:hypothetical protein [Actinomycetota bacterium]
MLLAFVALTVGFVAVGPGSQQPASAACSDVNTGYTINHNGGTETWNSGTCDNMNDYKGNLLDQPGGGCIWTAFNVSIGYPPLAAGNFGTSPSQCSTSSWKLYSYFDADNIGWIRMCREGVGCSATYWQNKNY